MNDETTKSLINLVPGSIDNAVKNLTDKPTIHIGQTISDIWSIVFSGVTHIAEKKKLKYANDLELFKKELDQKISVIPDDKKVEPKMHIVGPALDNSKYCVETEELRNMFSNLISNSLNKDFDNVVHPSFAEIIKQLSPLDAHVLSSIVKNDINPLINIRKINPNGGTDIFHQNITAFEFASSDEICKSIENLDRLKLIVIEHSRRYNNPKNYSYVRSNPIYKNLLISICSMPNLRYEEDYGLIEKNSFGLAFAKACMNI
jgi:hypothetical protein